MWLNEGEQRHLQSKIVAIELMSSDSGCLPS